jgi:ribosomal protein S18 acetylase RimI-like enzyme
LFFAGIVKDLTVRPFERDDQEAVRNLILAGLGDHFDVLDPKLNPDLENIWESYVASGDCFLVVEEIGRIIGSGALVWESAGVGRIVRMSVSAGRRRQGIGRLLVGKLLAEGSKRGYSTIVVETNDDWHGAIRLYRTCGFKAYDQRDGEIHMRLELVE